MSVDRNFWILFIVLGCLLTLSTPLIAHQDLLLQIEQLTEQLTKEPENTELLLKRGDLYRRHGEWSAGEIDFQKIRELSPDHPLIDWFEGRLLVEANRPVEGNELLTRFLLRNNQHSAAYRERAVARWKLQQPLQAARDYQSSIDNSERPSPSIFRSLVLSLVAASTTPESETVDAAVQAVQDGLRRFPTEISLLGLGVDLALARSDTQQAKDLMARLHRRLLALPQWQIRQALLACIGSEEEDARQRFADMISVARKPPAKKAASCSSAHSSENV